MFPNRYAYLLGAQDYQDARIPKLSTPINDINRVATVLEAYSFTVECIHNPTADQFRKVFDEDLKALPPDAQVIVYYAGHGLSATSHNDNQPDTEQGYLLPVDVVSTGNDVPDRAIPMKDIACSLAALPFSQLLLILDCCYAGMFQQAAHEFTPRILPSSPAIEVETLTTVADTPIVAERAIAGSRVSQRVSQEEFNAFTGYKARQIFTSTAYDQKAKDSYGGVMLANGNSPFADKLCDALSDDRETVDNNDGVITLFELQTYMQPRLDFYKQLCCIFPFAGHNGGEFVFLNRDSLRLSDKKRTNPFMGLMDYESKDAPYYFGRRAVINELTALVISEPFLVVIGASGSGKSSLVKAGILPVVESEPHLKVIQPGTDPMANLAALTPNPDRFLLIDQMEELVTQAKGTDRDGLIQDFFRAAFTLIDEKKILGIIGTLRIEFIKPIKAAVEAVRPAPPGQPSFWKQYLVPTFSIEDLTDIILRPAELVGVFFVPQRDVVGKIINDFRLYPNALPLLSLALDDLFSTTFRADHTIRSDDYKGIEAVLYKKENVLKDIKTDDLGLDANTIDEFRRNLMIRFVTYQQGTRVRRRIPYSTKEKGELNFGPTYDQLTERLLTVLETNRLIEKKEPKTDDKPGAVRQEGYVELAHEALIFSWDEFRSSLLELGSDALIRRSELANAAARYSPDDPMPWSNRQMLALFGNLERPRWTYVWPFRKIYQPGWGYFWPFKTFGQLFGGFVWLSVSERAFLKHSYNASRKQRVYVLLILLAFFLGFQGFELYLQHRAIRDAEKEARQRQQQLIEKDKDGIAQDMASADMLAYNNAYGDALKQYRSLIRKVETDPLLQTVDSLRAYAAVQQQTVQHKLDSTLQRWRVYTEVNWLLRQADLASKKPFENETAEIAESCQKYTYFIQAATTYHQIDDSLETNKHLFLDGAFRQTWYALRQQTKRGLDLTTTQLTNLQSTCLDVSAGFDLVSVGTDTYVRQRNTYKTISQTIADYLAGKSRLKSDGHR